MYWDLILGALAIIWIYFFVIKEKSPTSVLIAGKELWFALRPYYGIAICILGWILAVWGLNIDIPNAAKKTCIIIMVLSTMYIIYRLVKTCDLNAEGLFLFTFAGTIVFWLIMVLVFIEEFESCLGG